MRSGAGRPSRIRAHEFRLAPEAEAELDDIWLHIAGESGKLDLATSVIENIAEHFWLLARYPYLGRSRDEDLRPGLRSFPVGDYLIIYRVVEDDVALILHVLHGRRDLARLFARDPSK